MRRFGLSALAALLLLPAGCGEDGPKGPGSYDVLVESTAVQPMGAVLDLLGPGITGATGSGETRVWSSRLPGDQGLRVVAVNPGSGAPLQFQILVSELGAVAPEGAVLMGTDAGNRHVSAVGTYRVRITR